MLVALQRNATLWLKEKTGFTAAFFIFAGLATVAAPVGFIFLCVSGYAWAATELGPVFGGVASAGVFLAIAACSLALASSSRKQARQRAALERARRGQGTSLLINPKTLQVVMQAGRHIGWQRLIPIALLGFLATQFARQQRRREGNDLYQQS
jgi:hypothetical protein